jgi:hypothetical protein
VPAERVPDMLTAVPLSVPVPNDILQLFVVRGAPKLATEKVPEVILDALRFGILEVARTPVTFEPATLEFEDDAIRAARPLMLEVVRELTGRDTVPDTVMLLEFSIPHVVTPALETWNCGVPLLTALTFKFPACCRYECPSV